jgi:hypothetical protein
MRQLRADYSDTEDVIEVNKRVPSSPRSNKQTETRLYLRDNDVAMKVRALTAMAGERPTTVATALNQMAHEKANRSTNVQIKVLTDLIKSMNE